MPITGRDAVDQGLPWDSVRIAVSRLADVLHVIRGLVMAMLGSAARFWRAAAGVAISFDLRVTAHVLYTAAADVLSPGVLVANLLFC